MSKLERGGEKGAGGTTDACFVTVYFFRTEKVQVYVTPGVNESKAFKFRFINNIYFINCYSISWIYFWRGVTALFAIISRNVERFYLTEKDHLLRPQ